MGDVFLAIAAFFLGAVLVAGASAGALEDFRKEAVERGHAEWVVDSAGKTEWRWKEASK